MKRRNLLQSLLAAPAALGLPAWAAEPDASISADTKVLRYAFRIAETGFDPPHLLDIYSRILAANIFEALYVYDYLAQPCIAVPNIAVALPETSDDFKTYTVRIKPGIYFADDPAFKGKRRELTAQDFVYSFKRFADPANNASNWSSWQEAGLIGLVDVRERALKSKQPFDYDHEIEGLRALDRYTLQFKLMEGRPRFIDLVLAGNDQGGAVAREVVAFYGDQIMAHPVGTGPFRLAEWRRSSHIVFERNPTYRERYYDAKPNADDAEGQALLVRFKGRRLPLIDRVEVSIIEENQPRWLSFLNQESDLIERVPEEFMTLALPNNHIAPFLAKKGIKAYQVTSAEVTVHLFNMEDPVIGGYTPAKIALRRAISLSLDMAREIRLVRHGQAVPAQSIVQPLTGSYSNFHSEAGTYDPERAKALLDTYGYVDRDGDGWREQPDGSPLVIVSNTQSDGLSRQLEEQWNHALTAIGIKTETKVAQWPENLRSVQAGNYMAWLVNYSASTPDAQGALQELYGKADGANLTRFKLPAFDKIYERTEALPDGPERQALFEEAQRLAAAYMPIKYHVNRVVTDMAYPWLVGYRRPPFSLDYWAYVDIDTALLHKA